MTDTNADIGMEDVVGTSAEAAAAMSLDDDGETPPCLQTMPADVLRHALLFVGDVPDLLSCERTCVALRRAISDDDGGGDAVWRSLLLSEKRDAVAINGMFLSPPAGAVTAAVTHGEFLDRADADPRLKTNREVACVLHGLQLIQHSGAEPNVFVDELGVDGWMRLVAHAFNDLGFRTSLQDLPPGAPLFSYAVITPDESFDDRQLMCTLRLRGDSSVVLSELLQQDMIDLFAGANLVLAEEMAGDRCDGGCDDNAYPCLLARHLRVAYWLAGGGSEHLGRRTRDAPPADALTYAQCSRRLFRAVYVTRAESVLKTMTLRDRVIRGLALRAGVVKLHPDAFGMAWSMLIHRTVALVEVPCRELFSLGRGVVDTKRPLDSDQTMWDTPPYPRTMAVRGLDLPMVTVYTPAPRQLEETAHSLGIRAHRVFIHGWHVPAGSSLEKEVAAAALEYAHDENGDVCMPDAGLHEDDGDYVVSRGIDDESPDDHYLSSDYSSCGYPSSDFDSDDDSDEDSHASDD